MKEKGQELTVYIPPRDLDLLEELERIAQMEMRTFSSTVRMLLRRIREREAQEN